MKIIQPKKLRKLEDEDWRKISETNGVYAISNYGRIKSYTQDKKNGRLLKPTLVKQFLTINLARYNVKGKLIHRIVAKVWLNKPSEEYTHVIHKDWNTRNNHVSNLEWATKEDVIRHLSEYMKRKNSNPDKLKLHTYERLYLKTCYELVNYRNLLLLNYHILDL